MEFLAVFIQTLVKMILLMGVAVGGIFIGKNWRNKKDAKKASVLENDK